MRIHTFELICDVCGGPGMGTIQTAGAAWVRGNTITHSDPRICRDYLDRKRRELETLKRNFTATTWPG
jgi:hypothetical protein